MDAQAGMLLQVFNTSAENSVLKLASTSRQTAAVLPGGQVASCSGAVIAHLVDAVSAVISAAGRQAGSGEMSGA